MFTNDIALNPTSFGGANVNQTYALVGWGGDSSSIRRVAATAATTPETLTVSHRQAKDGSVKVDQHMVRLDEVLSDPVLGTVKHSAWLVLRIPSGTTVVTSQRIKDLVGRLIAFEQAVGALDKLVNSEP